MYISSKDRNNHKKDSSSDFVFLRFQTFVRTSVEESETEALEEAWVEENDQKRGMVPARTTALSPRFLSYVSDQDNPWISPPSSRVSSFLRVKWDSFVTIASTGDEKEFFGGKGEEERLRYFFLFFFSSPNGCTERISRVSYLRSK